MRLDVAVHLVAAGMADNDVTLDNADYFSVACLQLLEPVLYMLGYGRYPIECGPGHAMVAVLVHHEVRVQTEAEECKHIGVSNGCLCVHVCMQKLMVTLQDHTTESLNRIVDMNGFFSGCLPLLTSCRASNYGTTTLLSLATKVQPTCLDLYCGLALHPSTSGPLNMTSLCSYASF